MDPHRTLRFHSDPLHRASDKQIVDALVKVRLWGHFAENISDQTSPAPAIISTVLDRDLSVLKPLSHGQVRLLNFARALVQASSRCSPDEMAYGVPAKPILLLDEVASSLDPDIEEVIESVIEEEFVAKGHTVIMISHRPDTAMRRLRPMKDSIIWLRDSTMAPLQIALRPSDHTVQINSRCWQQ